MPALGMRDTPALHNAVEAALAVPHPTVTEAVVNSDHYIDTVFD